MSLKSVVAAARLCAQPLRQANAVRSGQAKLSTTSTQAVRHSPVPKLLAEKQKAFQVDNGLPVHVKGGPIDRLLYLATAIVCGVGIIECFHVYYVISFPQVKKD